MFNFGSILKKIFGTKSEKDLKHIQPIVDQINQLYASYGTLSDDALRAKTAEFKQRIQTSVQSETARVEVLKKQADDFATPINEKDDIYAEIDRLESEMTGIIEEKLHEILPEAFAVIRETSRRLGAKQKTRSTSNTIGS
jgi:preprotein translocase subunit SecA